MRGNVSYPTKKDYSPLHPSPLAEEIVVDAASQRLELVPRKRSSGTGERIGEIVEADDLERMLEEALQEEEELEREQEDERRRKSLKRKIIEDAEEQLKLMKKKQRVCEKSTSPNLESQPSVDQNSTSCNEDSEGDDEQPVRKPGRVKTGPQVAPSRKRKRSVIGEADDEEARHRSNRVKLKRMAQIKPKATKRKREDNKDATADQEHSPKRRFCENENAAKSRSEGTKRKSDDSVDATGELQQSAKRRFCEMETEKPSPSKNESKKRKHRAAEAETGEDTDADRLQSAKRRFVEVKAAASFGAKRGREEYNMEIPVAERRFAEGEKSSAARKRTLIALDEED